jgi:carbonic anhydrase
MSEKSSRNQFSRRNLIKFGAGFIGTGSLAVALGKDLASPRPAVAQNDITPQEALQMLMEGNDRFVNQKRNNPNQDMMRLTEVAHGQNPLAAILSCADSRVPPEIVFDQGLGDLFVVRGAGNVATPEETGSLEFGTLVLGAKVLMVIGHESCGAVKATMKGEEVPGQIGSILEAISPAVTEYKGQQNDPVSVEAAAKSNVKYQMEKLLESPVISELVTTEKLMVVGGYYDLDTGAISMVS